LQLVWLQLEGRGAGGEGARSRPPVEGTEHEELPQNCRHILFGRLWICGRHTLTPPSGGCNAARCTPADGRADAPCGAADIGLRKRRPFRLRGGVYGSGLQPSGFFFAPNLGLRPRLVCRRAFSPWCEGTVSGMDRQTRGGRGDGLRPTLHDGAVKDGAPAAWTGKREGGVATDYVPPFTMVL
jgi:hypothetical protein